MFLQEGFKNTIVPSFNAYKIYLYNIIAKTKLTWNSFEDITGVVFTWEVVEVNYGIFFHVCLWKKIKN